MNKEFVPYDLALALERLGFEEPCTHIWFKHEGGEWFLIHRLAKTTNSNRGRYTTPTGPLYQQAFRWFREKYGLEGVVQQAEDFTWYKWKISQYNEDGKKYVADWYEYETYEEAELACLEKLIEIVNQNKDE